MATKYEIHSLCSYAEQRYNEEMFAMRVKVENAFGIWKKMFPALLFGLRKQKAEHFQYTIIGT